MKKGVTISATIVIVFVLAISYGIYYINQNRPLACTEDARICPDGSSVVRVLPDCEFETCPLTECAEEGEISMNDATGEFRECCADLIQTGNFPSRNTQEECEEIYQLAGFGSICLNCGNNICEDTENLCTCPEDCN